MSQNFVFGEFRLSPRRRVLTRGGREVPLIPRYLVAIVPFLVLGLVLLAARLVTIPRMDVGLAVAIVRSSIQKV